MFGEMEGLISAVRCFDGTASARGYSVIIICRAHENGDGLKCSPSTGSNTAIKAIDSSKDYPFLNPYYAAIAADGRRVTRPACCTTGCSQPEGKKPDTDRRLVPSRSRCAL
jgi:hypothetical protein